MEPLLTLVKKRQAPQIIDILGLAAVLHISERRIHQLVKLGLPRYGHGQYDKDACVDWYILYTHSVIEKRSISDGRGGYSNEREQRLRLLCAKADLRELELAEKRGTLITIAESEKVLTELVLTTKARIMAIGAIVAPELEGETSRLSIQAKIESASKEALRYLANAANHNFPQLT